MNVHSGTVDTSLLNQLKKHSNYCNKIIKREVREQNGKIITEVSSVKRVWKSINDILKPETINKKSIKIETENNKHY